VTWLLESTMGRILGVDTTGQQVPPHVRYGMTCLLIRNTIGSVSCSGEWRMTRYFSWDPNGARGAIVGNLSTASGAFVEKL
jgi:hypothetical protein